MEIGKYRTGIVLVITGLWAAVTICGWTGKWFIGLILGILLMFLHMVMGAAHNGKIHKKLLIYPLVPWCALWIVGFFFAKYYADQFMNIAPSFKILGFHPSFAFVILAYWIGGVLTLTLGLIKNEDAWLSEENWQAFKTKIDALNNGGGKHE